MRLAPRFFRDLLLTSACLALAACGGDSKSDGPNGSGSAADGGTSNGGADSGEAGSGDTGGAATGARSSGGGANGGAPGSAGSEPGEAGADNGGGETGGGEAGGSETGGSETGSAAGATSTLGGAAGSTETGGTDAGGAEAGGETSGGADVGGAPAGGVSAAGAPAAGGEAGGAGGATSPPDTACSVLCAKEQAAGCTATGTAADCLASCRVLEGFQACETEVSAMLDCAGTATTSCDSSDEVVFEGCDVEQLAVVACIETAPPPEELVEPCTSFCEARAEVACPSDDPTTCLSECGMLGNIAAACTPDWIAYLDCAASGELACSDGGEAEPVGCTAETLTALACITAEVQSP